MLISDPIFLLIKSTKNYLGQWLLAGTATGLVGGHVENEKMEKQRAEDAAEARSEGYYVPHIVDLIQPENTQKGEYHRVRIPPEWFSSRTTSGFTPILSQTPTLA